MFNDYRIEGLDPSTREYLRDYLHLDRHTPGVQRPMRFAELRDNLYNVLSGGDFTMELPKAVYDSTTHRYSFRAHLETKPNFKVSIGGNVSSTVFNQAYIGINYQKIGRVGHSLGADLYLGPLYTWGALGGRADFYLREPIYLDYAYNFSVRDFRRGAFGNVTRVDNTLYVKNSESFFTLGLGTPLTLRSVVALRANAGHINYHYGSDNRQVEEDDHTRFSFFALKAEVARNTLDKFLYPRRGSDLHFSAIYVTGRDKYAPAEVDRFLSRRTRHWFGGRFTWDKYFDIPPVSWFSFGFNIDAVLTNHPDFTTPGATLMSMPVYAPIPHAKMVYMPDFRAERFVAGGVMPTFDLMPNFFLRTGFYAMMRNKRSFVPVALADRPDRRWHYIAEALLVYHTPIGPVSLALTKYDLDSWRNMYLTFNFGYTIFAPKGTFY